MTPEQAETELNRISTAVSKERGTLCLFLQKKDIPDIVREAVREKIIRLTDRLMDLQYYYANPDKF